MTEINWVETLGTMKWTVSTFDCLVEAFRSAPTEESKGAMLSIIGEFGSRLQVPDPEETTEPVPDEYKTLMDDWEQAQNKFEQWTILARMKDILTSFDCMVDAVRAASTQKSKRAVVRGIGKHRSEWSQMPSLEEMAEPEIANEYKIMMDEWEQVEHKFEQWALDEIPAVGSA